MAVLSLPDEIVEFIKTPSTTFCTAFDDKLKGIPIKDERYRNVPSYDFLFGIQYINKHGNEFKSMLDEDYQRPWFFSKGSKIVKKFGKASFIHQETEYDEEQGESILYSICLKNHESTYYLDEITDESKLFPDETNYFLIECFCKIDTKTTYNEALVTFPFYSAQRSVQAVIAEFKHTLLDDERSARKLIKAGGYLSFDRKEAEIPSYKPSGIYPNFIPVTYQLESDEERRLLVETFKRIRIVRCGED